MSETREDSVYLAKLAEQAERYEGEYSVLTFTQVLRLGKTMALSETADVAGERQEAKHQDILHV